MAMAGAIWIREEAYMSTYRSDEYAKAMLGSMSIGTQSTKDFSPFNASHQGIYSRYQVTTEHLPETNQMRTADGAVYDMSWLLPRKG